MCTADDVPPPQLFGIHMWEEPRNEAMGSCPTINAPEMPLRGSRLLGNWHFCHLQNKHPLEVLQPKGKQTVNVFSLLKLTPSWETSKCRIKGINPWETSYWVWEEWKCILKCNVSNNYSTIKMWGSHLCLGDLAVFLNKRIQVTIVWFPPWGELMSMWRFIIILDHENLYPYSYTGTWQRG